MSDIRDAMLIIDGLGFAHVYITKIDLENTEHVQFASEAEAREFLTGWKAGATIETFFKVTKSETPPEEERF